MKRFLKRIYKNRGFLLFVLLFAYVQSIYIRITVRKNIDAYIFTPEAAIASFVEAGLLFLIILFFIRRWQKSETLNQTLILKIFGTSWLSYILLTLVLGFSIALAFGNIEQNFNQKTLLITILSDSVDTLIYGSFFLAYYYYQDNQAHLKKLALYNEALASSKINQLKAQLNPHFLFNNLNVLDQLIDEDKHKASDFLNEFAEIYRYLLQVSDKKLVPIQEELDFAQQYFRLFEYKYGDVYRLNLNIENVGGNIVPLTLQLLIENAIQHNLGTSDKPIIIDLHISNQIIVSNNINLKRNVKPTSGRALKNLKEQYQLLSQENIEIEQNNPVFKVCMPIIP